MKIRKDVILAILATFCLTVTLFSLAPVMSTSYDPWADVRGTDPSDPNIPDGKIDMRDISYIATMFTLTGDPTKNVTVTNWPSQQNANVTNWPQDRPLTIKEGIEKIVVIDISQGLEFHETTTLYFYCDFEPKGSFINVTEIYYNIVSKNGYLGGQHIIRLPDTIPIDTHTWVKPFMVSDVIESFHGTASNYAYSEPFNFSYIHQGMNQVAFDNTQIGHGSLWVYSLELFIEYYYWG